MKPKLAGHSTYVRILICMCSLLNCGTQCSTKQLLSSWKSPKLRWCLLEERRIQLKQTTPGNCC